MSITEHSKRIVLSFIDQIQFLSTFSTRFRPLCFFRPVFDQKAVEKGNKNGFWSVQGEAVSWGCSVMPNNRLEIVWVEFMTSIDHIKQFYVNLLFNRSIDRPMCTHMGQLRYVQNAQICERNGKWCSTRPEKKFAEILPNLSFVEI